MSDLLNSASLVMIPSGYKEDVVYSQIPTDGSGDLSFTRASNGTRINSAGLVEVCPWNLFEQSNAFSTSPWTLFQGTLASGQSGYDGLANAWKYTEGTFTASLPVLTQSFLSSTSVETYSFYAKGGTRSWVIVSIGLAGYTWVNVTTGVVGGTGGGNPPTITTQLVGNGWYFVQCVNQIVAKDSFTIHITDANNSVSYNGDGTGFVYVQNAQRNIGSTAKPYFPTTDRLNVPRLTYQNGGGCPSLLLEKQSTNINAKSNDFVISSGYWYDYNSKTPVANQGTSPDGTNNAWSIPTNSALTTEYGKTIGLSIGDKTAASIWAKGSETAFRLYIENVTNTDILGSVTVNLTTGAITSGSGSVESYGNGWYRISTIGTSTVTNGYPRSIVSNPNTSCLIYGSQFEASSYPTSYIPTTSSSATRVADACFKTGISSLIGASAGTLFLYADIQKHNDADFYIAISNGASLGDALYLYQPSGGILQVLVRKTGNSDAVVTIANANWTAGLNKVAIAYTATTIEVFMNGVSKGSTTFTALPTLSQFTIGSRPDGVGTLVGTGIYSEAVVFPTRLTDSECISLTTI
jgi:hypothetical protein